mmetsp:Transcript_11901/g.17479  ORF Transcript_11901/g.17479 Transcript_11901/m.17479 type:complete len:219 (-) Transcript_11901:728-1384(-)
MLNNRFLIWANYSPSCFVSTANRLILASFDFSSIRSVLLLVFSKEILSNDTFYLCFDCLSCSLCCFLAAFDSSMLRSLLRIDVMESPSIESHTLSFLSGTSSVMSELSTMSFNDSIDSSFELVNDPTEVFPDLFNSPTTALAPEDDEHFLPTTQPSEKEGGCLGGMGGSDDSIFRSFERMSGARPVCGSFRMPSRLTRHLRTSALSVLSVTIEESSKS